MKPGICLTVVVWLLGSENAAQAQCQTQKLLPDGAGAEDLLGRAVALDGATIAVGAIGDDERADGAGAVYLYEECCGGEWSQTHKLLASDGVALDIFGAAISVHDGRVVIGAPWHGFAGAAYVFERGGDQWVQDAKLTPVGIGVNTSFGLDVGCHGDIVVGGARLDNPRGLSSGSAVVFERQKDGKWLQVARIFPNDGGVTDFFGISVAAGGNTIVGGAHSEDERGANAGAAYVFERCGEGCWTETAKLLADDGTDQDAFGTSVAISGERIVVGAPGDDDDRGAAYVFERSPITGRWTQVAKLTADDGAADDKFGRRVDISEDVVLVGAWGHVHRGGRAGSAYVFRRDEQARWIQDAAFTADDVQPGLAFGGAVGLDGAAAVVGAEGDDEDGPYTGSAYVFRLALPPRSGDLDCDGAVGFADLLVLLAAWGPVPDCPPSIMADVDGDCDVDFGDLLILLAGWG